MTLYRARLHYCLAHAAARAAAVALALCLPLLYLPTTALAQGDIADDCAANNKNRPLTCATREKAAAIVPTFAHDWVPLADVPESLRDRLCLICEGRYIDPLALENTSTRPEKTELHARADSTEMGDTEVVLVGDVTAIQGYRQMRSDTATIDREKETATLVGNVTLREPGMLLLGDNAKIYANTGEAIMYDAEFVFHDKHLRGYADILERDENDIIHIHNGIFTHCPPEERDWVVLSDTLDVDIEEGLATAHQATLELAGVQPEGTRCLAGDGQLPAGNG